MEQKYYLALRIFFVLTMILISGCIKETSSPDIEVWAIKTVTGPDGKDYESAIINEPVEFQIETLKNIHPNAVFRLVLPENVEYVSGDFELRNGELLLDPAGQLGADFISLNKTYYTLTIKGMVEGKHTIQVEAGLEDKLGTNDFWYEDFKKVTICSAKTLQKAIELCVQVEATCETPKCIEEKMKTSAVQE